MAIDSSKRRSTTAIRTSPAPRSSGAEHRSRRASRYLQQLDTPDRHEPSGAAAAKTSRLKEEIAKLGKEMQRLADLVVLPDVFTFAQRCLIVDLAEQ